MKKIICLIESLGPGGAERQLSYLASQLKREGYYVEVWTYYPNDFYSYILDKAEVKWRYVSKAGPRLQRVSVLRRELLKASPDVVIAYLDACTSVTCIIKSLGAKFKLIVSERNTTQELTFRERLKFFLYRWADYVVPNSYTQSEFIKNHYPNLAQKVRTITNFVDTDKFCPSAHKEKNDRTRILTVARVVPQKNVLRLLEVIRRLKEEGFLFKYDWFGSKADKEYYTECASKIVEYGISDVFEFHEQAMDIVHEYQRADVFCLPSIYEGFPNVVCEAMSCGVPIVCSNIGEHRIILDEIEEGRFFDPSSEKDMFDKMRDILSTENAALHKIGMQNRERALRKFDVNEFIVSYQNLIQ